MYSNDPFCHLCNSSSQGTYIHMFWDCPRIALLWSLVQDLLSDLLKTRIQKDPLLFLLLDDSSLSLSVNQKRILSAALTAAKKVILKLWLDPSTQLDDVDVILAGHCPFGVYHSQNTWCHQKDNTILVGPYWHCIRPLEILSVLFFILFYIYIYIYIFFLYGQISGSTVTSYKSKMFKK